MTHSTCNRSISDTCTENTFEAHAVTFVIMHSIRPILKIWKNGGRLPQ
jgi:hypothetical protein